MNNCEGKVAAITGAASGFGRELARLGARQRMRLALADVQRDALDVVGQRAEAHRRGGDLAMSSTSRSRRRFSGLPNTRSARSATSIC